MNENFRDGLIIFGVPIIAIIIGLVIGAIINYHTYGCWMLPFQMWCVK